MGDSVKSNPADDNLTSQGYSIEPSPYLRTADYLWISAFLFVVLINIWFGVHNHGEAHKVAETKANAERLLQWVADKGPIREQGQEVLVGCDDPKGSWHDCLAALIASGGPFESFRNYLEPDGKVFSEACDRSDLKTLGSIVIERGTPKPLDPSAMAYAKMPAAQTLSGKLPIKITVCGRSFHPMNVGEATF
jgi:hypothetical protein